MKSFAVMNSKMKDYLNSYEGVGVMAGNFLHLIKKNIFFFFYLKKKKKKSEKKKDKRLE